MRALRSLAAWRCAALALCLGVAASASHAAQTLRVGTLAFGTVNWELQTIQRQGLDLANGVKVEIVALASADASTVALQGGAVDVIVSDWLWVARQRAAGKPYSFYPYANAVGAILVRPDSGIHQLSQLRGKRLGVAGGPFDKSWLLLRAHAQHSLGADLADWVTPQFGAPPLLNELLLRGELDAVLNYWHFAARLRAQGMREIVSVEQALRQLGIGTELPLVGWVFDANWARNNAAAINGFLSASAQAKALLARSDAAWQPLRAAMKTEGDEALFVALRQGFRAGIPHCLGAAQRDAARRAFDVFVQRGGAAMLGGVDRLDEAMFWSAPAPKGCLPL